MNINIGGTKKWGLVDPKVRMKWRILDIAGEPDFEYDLNSSLQFPIETETVDAYYSSHTIEHICPQILPFVLKEIYRTLKKGGKIRIVVPNVRLAIQKYVENDTNWMKKAGGFPKNSMIPYPNTMLGHLMIWFYSTPKGTKRSGHNIVFDWESLVYYFEKANFIGIRKCVFNQGSKVFNGLDFLRHKDKSLYLEAIK